MAHNPPITNLIPGEYGYPFQLKARYANFIGGEWVLPLCEVASSGRDDIDLALDAAHAARPGWGATSVQERAAILYRIADRMERNLELLAAVETWDNGKPIRETLGAAGD